MVPTITAMTAQPASKGRVRDSELIVVSFAIEKRSPAGTSVQYCVRRGLRIGASCSYASYVSSAIHVDKVVIVNLGRGCVKRALLIRG